MSKRLEEIIEKVKRSDEYAEKGLWEASDRMIVHLHNEGYINYLIERVQELENIIYQDERQAVLEGMYEQKERYREALEFINEELELVLHSNRGLAEKMFYIENSKRKITEVLEGESE